MYNNATSFFDLSTVYGSNEEDHDRLRTRTGGKLIMAATNSITVSVAGIFFDSLLLYFLAFFSFSHYRAFSNFAFFALFLSFFFSFAQLLNIIIGVPTSFTFEDILPSYNQTGLHVNPSLLTLPFTYIFTSGDGRVNENIALTLMHHVFAKEHNLLCDELMAENPQWYIIIIMIINEGIR